MRKLISFIFVFALLTCISYSYVLGEETIDLTLPQNMPEDFINFYWIGGTDTNGVTFVVKEASYDEQTLKISVIQLPNDDYTSVVDNQVACPPNDSHFKTEIKLASQYGTKVLGTLCDILTLTDEHGNNMLNQYSISTERSGSSLVNEFTVYLSPENIGQQFNVVFIFGVNEDLQSRFRMADTLELCLTILDEESTAQS